MPIPKSKLGNCYSKMRVVPKVQTGLLGIHKYFEKVFFYVLLRKLCMGLKRVLL